MNHAYFQAFAANEILVKEVSAIRKRELDNEERVITKRLKQQDNKRI